MPQRTCVSILALHFAWPVQVEQGTTQRCEKMQAGIDYFAQAMESRIPFVTQRHIPTVIRTWSISGDVALPSTADHEKSTRVSPCRSVPVIRIYSNVGRAWHIKNYFKHMQHFACGI